MGRTKSLGRWDVYVLINSLVNRKAFGSFVPLRKENIDRFKFKTPRRERRYSGAASLLRPLPRIPEEN